MSVMRQSVDPMRDPRNLDPAADVAHALLRIGAFAFSPDKPFTWASGIKSPLYCDNRLILGHPEARKLVVAAFRRAFGSLPKPQPDLIVGTATAGIPHAAWLSAELDLPMAYVRSSAKDHGKGRMIEGVRPDRQHALLIEDLVSTGGSSLGAIEALRAADLAVDTVLAVFTYGLPIAQKRMADAGCRLVTLTDLNSLIEVAVAEKYMDEDTARRIEAWRGSL